MANVLDMIGSNACDSLLSAGGRVWVWGQRTRSNKLLRTLGVDGAAMMRLLNAERQLVIEGLDGAPAILRVSSTIETEADRLLTMYEDAILEIVDLGSALTWRDDMGRTGQSLVLTDYERIGHRIHGTQGTAYHAWQLYRLRGVELDGKP